MTNLAAIGALAEDVHRAQPDLPEILATPEVAAEFLDIWNALAAVEGQLKWRQQIYALARVIPPASPAAGCFRAAESPDNEQLLQWAEGFQQEAFRDSSAEGAERARRAMSAKLNRGEMYLWDLDGAVRAMAGAQGPTSESFASTAARPKTCS